MNPELIGRSIAEAIHEWTTRKRLGAKIVIPCYSNEWGPFYVEIAPNDAMMSAVLKNQEKRQRNAERKRAK